MPPDNHSKSAASLPSNAMWGGRFSAAGADIMTAINASIRFDQRLAAEDIAGSLAHARMLVAQNIISASDGEAIREGLRQIEQEIASGRFDFQEALEDIHMNVEARLAAIIGPAAGRLHTARSRNDQVATDFRLWLRGAMDATADGLERLIAGLIARAGEETGTVMPGFTHLQTAQPVTLGHHLLAYAEMFLRDLGRFADARKRLNECPLGAAALAGTAFPIDRQATAEALGFDRPMANSLDAVSSRDFAAEYLAAAAILSTHLSRLAEELVLWCTPQFGFITFTDAFSTGSSIMPQKRNPDAAELIRGKTGRVFGALIGLLTVLKGLPLAYSKDMQEDKEPVFDVHETIGLGLAAMTGMVADMQIDRNAMRKSAAAGFSTATDLADWLVRTLDVPFRNAHHITGRIVALAEAAGCDLPDLSLDQMRSVDARITGGVFEVLGVEASVRSRISYGGTAPDRVSEQVEAVRTRLNEQMAAFPKQGT